MSAVPCFFLDQGSHILRAAHRSRRLRSVRSPVTAMLHANYLHPARFERKTTNGQWVIGDLRLGIMNAALKPTAGEAPASAEDFATRNLQPPLCLGAMPNDLVIHNFADCRLQEGMATNTRRLQ